ncbi:hypothetical protein CBR_g33933 [Chara braunii]|uniref:Uncharacterized protein n=1 Tax=Chara braunii TaxID=69332 RepID=A0A388LHN4_CHABU|nr:hypothetical protein CBR_g33933 [Chara braunii]|eukprot:GBG81755.1 hypothetical protein CBR_g33933 [Chara braunii]
MQSLFSPSLHFEMDQCPKPSPTMPDVPTGVEVQSISGSRSIRYIIINSSSSSSSSKSVGPWFILLC